MVNNKSLDKIFQALADPTRRSMVERLGRESLTVEALTPHYNMSAPAISKHLRVLEKAKLITRTKQSRNVVVSLEPYTLTMMTEWAKKYSDFWEDRLDALAKVVETK